NDPPLLCSPSPDMLGGGYGLSALTAPLIISRIVFPSADHQNHTAPPPFAPNPSRSSFSLPCLQKLSVTPSALALLSKSDKHFFVMGSALRLWVKESQLSAVSFSLLCK